MHDRVMKLAATALALLLCAMPGGRAMARGPLIPSPTYRWERQELAREVLPVLLTTYTPMREHVAVS